jgi:hypothetical protein
MSIDELIKNTNHVQRLWSQARPASDRADAARERAERLASIDAGVRDGTYPDDGARFEVARHLMKTQAKRELSADTAVNPDDAVEHYERFE